MASARFLVTGATGLLGNNVVRLLLERGERVRALVRRDADPRVLAGLNVEIARGDVRDAPSVRAAAAGVAAIVHSAAWVQLSWVNLKTAHEINVVGTCHVADAAQEVGARLLHVSSIDALAPGTFDRPADEDSPGQKLACNYVVTKRAAEREVLQRVGSGLDAVIVNPGYMIGPWDWRPSSGRMLLEIAQRFAPVAPRGGISICDPRDVATGILTAIERGRPGRRYILAGENMPYFEAWRRFAALTGRRGPLKRMSRPVGWLVGALGDAWERCTGRESLVNSAAISLGNTCHYYTSQRAADELGYRSRPADESIRDAWEWFREHGYVPQHPPRTSGGRRLESSNARM
jgi:dihydroflavonol-4-reductase